MGNKLYEENSISAIASAIRSKLGTEDTYKVSEMADAISSILVPSGKITITENETGINITQYATLDVNVLRGSAFLTPVHFDYVNGYVQTGKFYRNEGEINNRNDIYWVDKNKRYKLTFGQTCGNRARVMLTDVDVTKSAITSGVVATGTTLSDSISPNKQWDMYFTANISGYVIVSKDNASTDGIQTFLICMSDLND